MMKGYKRAGPKYQGKRRDMRILDEEYALLKRLGEGNASKGLRMLLKEFLPMIERRIQWNEQEIVT